MCAAHISDPKSDDDMEDDDEYPERSLIDADSRR